MTDYRKLDVYTEVRALTRAIYFGATRPLPPYLRWRLGGQLDAAVDSIGANLAEGSGRKNPLHANSELIRYGFLSHGSACEVEHRIATLRDRELISDDIFDELNTRTVRIKAMLRSLIGAWAREDRGRTR
jgi:four helix bundle protein